MQKCIVRQAEHRDLETICAILNREIREGIAHFGTQAQTVAELEEQFDGADVHPWFVADVNGAVAGFARCGRWKARSAYDWAVEVSVYVAPEHQGSGIGRALYADLFDAMEYRGFRRVIAGMTMPNDASEGLHRAMGMRLVGTYERNGYKNGKWHDVRYYQLDLPRGGDCNSPPEPMQHVIFK